MPLPSGLNPCTRAIHALDGDQKGDVGSPLGTPSIRLRKCYGGQANEAARPAKPTGRSGMQPEAPKGRNAGIRYGWQ